MWFLLLACTEYDVISDPKDPPAGEEEEVLLPSVSVSPDAVELGVTCGEGSSTLTVESVGESALTVEHLRFEGGWSADTSALPLLLDPGQSWSVEVKGSGEGKARLKTDDPETPLVEIPLSSTANSAPVLTVLTPTSGDILSSSSTDFTASVSDDLDLPETIGLSWTSDVDGLLGSDPAGADGIAHYLWDPAVRSPGNHTTTLTATDSCGAQTSTQVVFCQDQGYSADNLDLATWHFEGNAHWDSVNSWVELTNNSNYQSGTAFQTASTVPANNVVISFSFFVSGGSGADGISLTALDSSRMGGFVGTAGGGIGYQGLPGWSIEVDTWYNSELNDPTPEDHVSVHFDGAAGNVRAWAALPDMEDGAWHEMVVEVVAPNVKVAIDGVTYLDQAVPGNYNFPAYVGFTAATGGSTNYHLIDALTVTEYVCGG
jgi:hypothetical protein